MGIDGQYRQLILCALASGVLSGHRDKAYNWRLETTFVQEVFDIALWRTWWRYAENDTPWFSAVYHTFNLLEGCVWFTLSLLVLRRFLRFRRSTLLELSYACAFLTFAISDFREAWVQSSLLIWFKAINLVILLWLRHVVIKRFYPQARLY